MTKTARTTATIFFESGIAAEVHEITVIESEFEHERAVVVVDQRENPTKRFRSGAPVRIEWGIAPTAMRTFIGYVSHSEPIHRPGPDRRGGGTGRVRIICVGPTWVFKDESYQTFRGVSSSTAIKTIAEAARFDVSSIDKDPRSWPVLHQAGRSYWEFMVDCAKKAGWTLYAQGLELHCADRKKAVSASRSYAPILSPVDRGGTIKEFENALGSTAPAGGDLRVRLAHSINPRNERILSLTNKGNTDRPMFGAAQLAPTFRHGETELSFESLGEAATKLSAAEKMNRLSIEAKVEGLLTPRVRVGSAIYVTGMPENDNGHWYVRSVTQRIRGAQDTYMSLVLGRDTEIAETSIRPTVLSSVAPRRGARLVGRGWVLS